jgi:predicted amidohydrolase YtcJ
VKRSLVWLAVFTLAIIALVLCVPMALGGFTERPSIASHSESGPVYLPAVMKRTIVPCDDEFNSGTLASCWSWVNETPSKWSLTARPGYLRILTDSGNIGDKNLLLQDAPAGEFEVSTRVIFTPADNFQMAGIVLWQDKDNYLKLGRAYCDPAALTCVGNGIYFDKMEGGTLGINNFAAATTSQSEAYLKVVRRGNDYHGYYSTDEWNWSYIGSHTIGAGVHLSRVGLSAGQDLAGAQTPADFDWFRFTEPLPSADVIFHNGNILPLGGSLYADEAVGIRDGKIWVLGAEAGVMKFRGLKTKVIDLGGRTLLPGFVDAHNHVFNNSDYWGLGLEAAQQMALENGITTMASAYTTGELVDALQALDADGKLRVRTSLYLNYTTNCGVVLGDWYKQYPRTDEPGEMLRIAGVKMFLDGGSCGCPAFSFNHPTCGYGDLWFTQAQANTIVSDIHNAGYQLAIHALGDRAADQALNAIQNALGGQANTLRHRIEHNAMLRDDQLPRYSQIGVVPIIFANYPCEYGTPLPAPYGSWEWRWRDLLDANPGLTFAWHSDVPGLGPLSPLKNLYSLVTSHEMNKAGDTICADHAWLTKKTLTVAEGLEMMTSGAAYALFREDEVGSIRLGKFADLVILSDNPATADPESIKDIQVLMTMVGGKVEYCKTGYEALCPGQ